MKKNAANYDCLKPNIKKINIKNSNNYDAFSNSKIDIKNNINTLKALKISAKIESYMRDMNEILEPTGYQGMGWCICAYVYVLTDMYVYE